MKTDYCDICGRSGREGHWNDCPRHPSPGYYVPPGADYTDRTGEAKTALLPTGSQERKDTPIYSGVMAYFPRALAYIAKVSKAGNDKHNPGQPLHWSKDKSNDHADCVGRHLIEHGTVDPDDGFRHSGKLAWRALALLETELETAANRVVPLGRT